MKKKHTLADMQVSFRVSRHLILIDMFEDHHVMRIQLFFNKRQKKTRNKR